jgi:hypothetical protein
MQPVVLYLCIALAAVKVGHVSIQYVARQEVKQTRLISSVPHDEGRWRQRVHQRAVCYDIWIVSLLLLVTIFWCGFIQLFETERALLVARREAAWAQPCPFHCNCNAGTPLHPPQLSLGETIYYGTIGPSHEQECFEYQRDVDMPVIPNLAYLFRDYVLGVCTFAGQTVGSLLAGFISQLPYLLQGAISASVPLVLIGVVFFLPSLVAYQVAAGGRSHAAVHRLQSSVSVEDVTYEENGRIQRVRRRGEPDDTHKYMPLTAAGRKVEGEHAD